MGVASVIIVLTFVANFLLLVILYRAKSTREIKNDCYGYYLINLSITNLLASIVSIITCVSYSTLECNFAFLLQLLCALHIISSSISIETVALMTMERYRVVQNPLRKRKTLSRVKRKIYFIWVWACANACPQLFLNKYVDIAVHVHQCDHERSLALYAKVYSFFLLISIIVIPTAIILICSTGVLLAYSTESALSLKRRKRYRRFVNFVFLLWVAFIVSNTPKYVIEIGVSMGLRSDYNELMFVIVLILSWSNYLLIPFIYISIYGRIIKPELWKIYDEGDNCRFSHIYQALHSPLFSSRSSSINDIETYLIRRPLLHIENIDGNVIQHINFELYNEEINSNRNSAISEGKHSIFRKRLGTPEKHTHDDNPFLNSLVPSVEHVINKLNQKDIPTRLKK